jgi:hypothetical protein
MYNKKKGLAVRTAQLTKTGQEYANHVSSILKSPPKKRPQIKIVESAHRPTLQSANHVPLLPTPSTYNGIPRPHTNQDDPRFLQIQ